MQLQNDSVLKAGDVSLIAATFELAFDHEKTTTFGLILLISRWIIRKVKAVSASLFALN